MNIPGLGEVAQEPSDGTYASRPIPLPLLKGKRCTVIVEGYDGDEHPDDFHEAIANLLACGFQVLEAASRHVFDYCQDMNSLRDPLDGEYVEIELPGEVWEYVQFGDEIVVARDSFGDGAVYVSIECGCDWEIEHGLQIVLRHGAAVTKVGPFDGSMTNADAGRGPGNPVYRRM